MIQLGYKIPAKIAMLAFVGLLSFNTAFANQSMASEQKASEATAEKPQLQKKLYTFLFLDQEPNSTCPSIDQLKKTKMRWSGPEGWKSSDDSFVDEIAYFMGAQWIGIKVGQIVCKYKGKREFTFPVTLERNDILVPTPKGERWGKDLGGYKQCGSKNPKICPFYIEPPTINTDRNLYDELRGLKK